MAQARPVALCIGASRGIGRQVAIDLAKNGYAVVVSAKTTSAPRRKDLPDPNSFESTINTVVDEIHSFGGDAIAVRVDVRSFESVEHLVQETIKHYGKLDVLVYNSGTIWWSSVEHTPMKRYKLMQQVNAEGLYGAVQACLPHFYSNSGSDRDRKGRGRIVVVSPPVYSRFFRGKTAYSMSKVACSVLTMGLSMDFIREGRDEMAITSIWPAAAIESAATQKVKADPKQLRKPTIFSDAIISILKSDVADVNGMCLIDEDFLRKKGAEDFSKYALVAGASPPRIMPAILPDLTVAEQDDEGARMDSTIMRRSRL